MLLFENLLDPVSDVFIASSAPPSSFTDQFVSANNGAKILFRALLERMSGDRITRRRSGGSGSFAKKAGWKGRRRTCRKERVVVKRVVKCLRAYFGNRSNIISLILVFVNLPHLTKVWKEGGTDGQVCRERDTAGLSLSFA